MKVSGAEKGDLFTKTIEDSMNMSLLHIKKKNVGHDISYLIVVLVAKIRIIIES